MTNKTVSQNKNETNVKTVKKVIRSKGQVIKVPLHQGKGSDNDNTE